MPSGRPRLADNERNRTSVTIRLDDNDYSLLEQTQQKVISAIIRLLYNLKSSILKEVVMKIIIN